MILPQRHLERKTSITRRRQLFQDTTPSTKLQDCTEWETIFCESVVGDVAHEEQVYTTAEVNDSYAEECQFSESSDDDQDISELSVNLSSLSLPGPPTCINEESNQHIDTTKTDKMDLTNGYSIVWDNVQLNSSPRHETMANQGRIILAAMSFAAVNRISLKR